MRTMYRLSCMLVALAAMAIQGCRDLTGSTGAGNCAVFEPSAPGTICVTGTVHYYTFEGGFWAIRGDDNITYDPLGALAHDFRDEGLRVRLEARIRSDAVSFHMAGPIIEILDIRRL